ncbi:LuxR C-terminal-related transcriptional regulator [Arthrobacter bussei]|uniref:LuxR C-terminal-related transcriptional regulator n=1 Tax=Arthrobacter bussei TaxID=2594179 RepID=UPI00177E22AD
MQAPPGYPVRFIGRAAETESALQTVIDPDSSGAVVVGAPGVGKTALLHQVLRSLPGSYVVRVRGLRSSASFPYRALSFLLSEVPGTVTHPALVLSAVSAHLREEAGGRPIVFAIDNAEHLDKASSTLIGQLLSGDSASAVLTVTDFAQADPVFMSLWRAGSLRRIDLRPLSFEDTVLFVASELGTPVSREGVEALWSVAGGNAQGTRAALQGFVQRGVLARRGEAWVLLPERKGIGHDVVSTSPLLRTLTRNQRRIVDLVSLAGGLPWKDAARLVDPSELDALQDAGVLVVLADPEPRVRLAADGLADAVAEQVPEDEAARLYQDLRSRPAAARHLAGDPAREVGWLLQAGLSVDAQLGVTAVQTLNRSGHHRRAADLIRRITTRQQSPDLALEAMIAALGQGHLKDATAASATLSASEVELDREVVIRHLVEESRLRRLQAVGDPASPLDRADEWLASWGLDPGGQPPADAQERSESVSLGRRVRVARAELASFEGRYRDNLSDLEGMHQAELSPSSDREECESQVALQSLLLEAMVLQEPTENALRLAEVLARNLAHPEVSHQAADAALLRVEVAFLIAGNWAAGRMIFSGFRPSSSSWSLHRGSLADVAGALDLIARERVRDATALLKPVVEQLRVADRYGLLPLAGAVLTYCHALTRPMDRGVAHLPLAGHAEGSPWMVRRATRHYQVLSQALTGGRAEVALQLQERVPSDLRRGATMWAVISLMSALRLGSRPAAKELKALSENLEAPLAEVCLLYAEALLEADTGLLIRAVETAAASGDYRLAADMARSGIDQALADDDRTAYRLIHRRLREVLPERLKDGLGVATLGLLTAREREIAVLAATGRSNRAIAQHMYVSVRTVEGHLYQVYSKLSVNTRAELAELFPAEIDS